MSDLLDALADIALGLIEVERRREVDEVLGRPEVRAELEELKRLFGLSAVSRDSGDLDASRRAALHAGAAIWRIVKR